MVVDLAVFVTIGLICYEDFSVRRVHVVLFPVLATLLCFSRTHPHASVTDVGGNIIYLSFLISSVVIYLRIKLHYWPSFFAQYFGIGDLLFLLAIALSFGVEEYIFFTTASFMFAFSANYLLRLISPYYKLSSTIPLAGLQGIFFMGWYILLMV